MNNFIYYGHFYQQIVNEVPYLGRSTLEIIRRRNRNLVTAAAQNPGVLLTQRPKAVFVMLNPGGSRPSDGQEPGNELSPRQIGEDARTSLVRTCPDNTQQAIEKVMTDKHLDHVRVLNLFDIREPESKKLIKKIKCSLGLTGNRERIPASPEILSYSIFSCERRLELRDRLNAVRPRKIVVAWGVEKALIPFFELFRKILEYECPNLQLHGWQPSVFYHPGRKKYEWAKNIVENWP